MRRTVRRCPLRAICPDNVHIYFQSYVIFNRKTKHPSKVYHTSAPKTDGDLFYDNLSKNSDYCLDHLLIVDLFSG